MIDLMFRPRALEAAKVVARLAHGEQVDKAGRPYTEHLGRVAQRMLTDVEATVAWLHDIVEDTSVTFDDLVDIGFSAGMVDAVRVLTRRAGETYADYIDRVRTSGDVIAYVVKLADIEDHLEHNVEAISDSLVRRYKRARDVLQAGF